MKICIIYGSPRKGNTYRALELFKKRLNENANIEFVEFFLPKDMPHFCKGCYSCFDKDEGKCPHAQFVQPIAKAMIEADTLILTSPVYVLGESGGMKALLDHFGYIFMAHRPPEEMFSKVAMVISTATGMGTGNVNKILARNLKNWGVKRVEKCGFSIGAKNWDEMSEEKQIKLQSKINKKADKFYKLVKKRGKISTSISTRFIFMIMKGMISKYPDGNADKEYWKTKGWIGGKKRPF